MGLRASDAELLPVPCPAPMPSVPCSAHCIPRTGAGQGSQCWGVSSAPWAWGAAEPMGQEQGWVRGTVAQGSGVGDCLAQLEARSNALPTVQGV